MSTEINIKYKSQINSADLNYKFHKMYGGNGILSGFELSSISGQLEIEVASGEIFIYGTHISQDISSVLTVPTYVVDTTYYVIATYSHLLSTLTLALATSNTVSNSQLVIGEFLMEVGDTEVNPLNIQSNGDKLISNKELNEKVDEGTPSKATIAEVVAGLRDDVYTTPLGIAEIIGLIADLETEATELVAAINEIYNRNPISLASNTSGTDDYIATVVGMTAYETGKMILLKATIANTGAASLNINTLGAKPLVRGTSTPLSTGDIPANKYVLVVDNGSYFELLSQGENLSYSNHNHAGVYQPVGSYLTGSGVTKVTVSNVAPTSPTTGDLWIDTTL
jgi:hypothetical protein